MNIEEIQQELQDLLEKLEEIRLRVEEALGDYENPGAEEYDSEKEEED